MSLALLAALALLADDEMPFSKKDLKLHGNEIAMQLIADVVFSDDPIISSPHCRMADVCDAWDVLGTMQFPGISRGEAQLQLDTITPMRLEENKRGRTIQLYSRSQILILLLAIYKGD